VFRDESHKPAGRARAQCKAATQLSTVKACEEDAISSLTWPNPQPPMSNLGANFFFTKYSFTEEPIFVGYHDWLTSLYLDDNTSPALTAAIEAVGLAGLSNLSHGQSLQQQSRAQYGKALALLKKAFDDSVLAIADETLVAVILLILFEAGTPHRNLDYLVLTLPLGSQLQELGQVQCLGDARQSCCCPSRNTWIGAI
jgi:hypothetical protein